VRCQCHCHRSHCRRQCTKPSHSVCIRVLYADWMLDAPPIAVFGDWHGDSGWALTAIRSAAREGARTAIHVGDFGLDWPGAKRGHTRTQPPRRNHHPSRCTEQGELPPRKRCPGLAEPRSHAGRAPRDPGRIRQVTSADQVEPRSGTYQRSAMSWRAASMILSGFCIMLAGMRPSRYPLGKPAEKGFMRTCPSASGGRLTSCE
jgi:hypothetical protein